MRIEMLKTFAAGVALGVVGCSSSDPMPIDIGNASGGTSAANGGSTTATGGKSPNGNGGSGNTSTATGGANATGGTGNAASGGAASGGGKASTGGSPNGGAPTGGKAAIGGAPTGGKAAIGGAPTGGKAAIGGSPTGGKAATGGTLNGGSANGGSATGGKAATGGSVSGGSANGGAATGGVATGGKATGGNATGGAPTGGKATGGAVTAAGGSSSTVNCSAAPLTNGTSHCSSNASGSVNGLTWTIWSSGGGGCLYTYGVGGAFKATWNNSGDFLARVGLQWDSSKTYSQYGTVSADYAYTKTGTGGGYSFIGIYGWSRSPLIEYYVVDDWYGSGPPTGGGSLKGTFTVDDGTYKIYTNQRLNQPSIDGTQTFMQYFSVRQTARQCGHISITEHYKQWASLGLTLGKMYEAKILVEAGGGVGSIDFTTATVTAK